MSETTAVIFDMDGTLVATNAAHVEAWHRAFAALGYDVPRERVWREVGKGGDNLLPDVLGEEAAERDGERLAELHDEDYFATAAAARFTVYDGAEALIAELRRRGIRTALATSSGEETVEHTVRSAGVDFRELVDVIVDKDDADSSKPEPDLVVAAVRKLGVEAEACVMLGDTAHDAEACRRAGVPFVGVTCGGRPAGELRQAGARSVWRDPADVLAHLDEVLAQSDAAQAARE